MRREQLATLEGTHIAELLGLHGESIFIEHFEPKYNEPAVFIHGPQGGERYRFGATREQLVKFARDILAWNDPDDVG